MSSSAVLFVAAAACLLSLAGAVVVDLKPGEEFCLHLHPNIEASSPTSELLGVLAGSSSLPPLPPPTSLSGNYDYLQYSGLPSSTLPLHSVLTKVRISDGSTEVLHQSIPGTSEGTFAVDVHADVPSHDYYYSLCVANGYRRGEGRGRWPNEFGDEPTGPDGVERRMGVSLRVAGRAPDDAGPAADPRERARAEDREALESAVVSARHLLSSLSTMQDHQAYMRRREADHRDLCEGTNERVWRWTLAETAVVVALSVAQIGYLRGFFEQTTRL
mmetsp:Transcript_28490/g.56993  ORF Transcript_28490/g.56993 Transcript_28490/m.56993 type:complete len:273 (+) Transcript_28490:134-952(+)